MSLVRHPQCARSNLACFEFLEPGQILCGRQYDIRTTDHNRQTPFLKKIALLLGDVTRDGYLPTGLGGEEAPLRVAYLGDRNGRLREERLLVDNLTCGELVENWDPVILDRGPEREAAELLITALHAETCAELMSWPLTGRAYDVFRRLDRRNRAEVPAKKPSAATPPRRKEHGLIDRLLYNQYQPGVDRIAPAERKRIA